MEMTDRETDDLLQLLKKAGISQKDMESWTSKPKRKQPQASRYTATKSQVEKVESYHLELRCTCLLCKMEWTERFYMQRQKVKDEYGLLAKKLFRFPTVLEHFRKGKMKRLTCHCCERRLMAFATKRGLVRGLILESRKEGK